MGVTFAFTSRARCTTEHKGNHARGAPSLAAQCRAIPRCRMCAAAHHGSWVKVVHVRTLTVSFSVFFYFRVVQLTVVTSLNSAHMFCVRLGGHFREVSVKECITAPASPLGEVRPPFETAVSSTTTFIIRNSTFDQS